MSINAFCFKRILFKLLLHQAQNICSTQSFSSSSLNFFSKLNLPKNSFLNQKTFKMYSIQKDNTENNLSLSTSNDKIDAIALVKKVVECYKKKNLTFILPWGDSEAMNLIASPFEILLGQGLYPEFLIDACLKRTKLFTALTRNGKQLLEIIDIIMNCTGLTYENTIRFVSDYIDELLSVTPKSIQQRFFVFLSRGVVEGSQMAQVIRNHPEILFTVEPQTMDFTLESIATFFPADEMNAILISCPQVCLQTPESLKLKYEYIYFHMGIEPGEFRECIHWHDLSIEEIIIRHEVLTRTGKYIFPDPKHPQYKLENPPIFKIFDTNDFDFAKVAGIRKEEWLLFNEIYEKEKSNQNLERPYEIIKPSIRKAYEKKRSLEKGKQFSFENHIDY